MQQNAFRKEKMISKSCLALLGKWEKTFKKLLKLWFIEVSLMFTLLLYCRQSSLLWGKSPQTGIAVIAIGDKK